MADVYIFRCYKTSKGWVLRASFSSSSISHRKVFCKTIADHTQPASSSAWGRNLLVYITQKLHEVLCITEARSD